MKIAIIGATAGVGKSVAEQALKKGYQVVAFSRNPQKWNHTHPLLEIVAGDARVLEDVKKAVESADAVICTLGAPASSKSLIRSQGTENILRAMPANGRLICLSSLGFGDSRPLMPWVMKYIIAPFILKNALADHEKQEEAIKKSEANYTIVRPGSMTDKPAAGHYQYGFAFDDNTVTIKPISRADVADFLLNQVTDTAFLRQTVGISG
ncbi:MAG: SDR family oxidoreductase [Haliscomenobacter sp.]|nr:SDR family oxidoreductase [Haliscomenobacter sp.]